LAVELSTQGKRRRDAHQGCVGRRHTFDLVCRGRRPEDEPLGEGRSAQTTQPARAARRLRLKGGGGGGGASGGGGGPPPPPREPPLSESMPAFLEVLPPF
jgi:hypothetical protein